MSVAGLVSPASAADTITQFGSDSSITVEAASDVDISGKTLTAVPLGYYDSAVPGTSDATLASVTVAKVDDTTNTKIRDALVSAGLVTRSGTSPNFTYAAAVTCSAALDTSNYASWVAGCLHDSAESPWAGNLRDFLTALDSALGESPTGTALAAVEGAKNKQSVSTLTPGLYVILDRTEGNPGLRSVPMVVGTDVKSNNVTYNKLGTQDLGTVAYKATGSPDIDKNILEDENATATPDDYTDDTAKKHNQVNIGDTVTFELKVTVPLTAGYTSYWLELKDTLSKGLTFDAIKSVKSENTPLTDGTDYKVIGTGNDGAVEAAADGTTSFRVLFAPKANAEAAGGYDSNILQSGMTTKFATGKVLKVVYTAKLNADAVIEAAGNPNEVTLDYSNNPSDASSKGTTPPVETRTYTGQFSVCKVDVGGNKLTGAEFELYKGEGMETNNRIGFIGSAGSYKLPTGATGEATPVTTLSTNNNGCIAFAGLKSGDYTLKETKAPDNFSSTFMPTVTFTLTVTEPTAPATSPAYSKLAEKDGDTNRLVDLGASKTITVTPAVPAHDDVAETPAVTVTVQDSANVKNVRNITELPKTGAAWLGIFAAGAVVFAGSGALLMFLGRRRENA